MGLHERDDGVNGRDELHKVQVRVQVEAQVDLQILQARRKGLIPFKK